jgi:hypothetical protein
VVEAGLAAVSFFQERKFVSFAVGLAIGGVVYKRKVKGKRTPPPSNKP